MDLAAVRFALQFVAQMVDESRFRAKSQLLGLMKCRAAFQESSAPFSDRVRNLFPVFRHLVH
jgi:hypothetical protein